MKRRIIRASVVTAAEDVAVTDKKYPEGYIELQKAMQRVRHLIEQHVDDKLEPYAYWDQISAGMFAGIVAISKCCEDMQTGVTSSTEASVSIMCGLDDKYPRVVQVDGRFYELDDRYWVKTVVVPGDQFNHDTLGPAFDIIEDHSLDQGTDEGGAHHIDISDRIQGVDDTGYQILKDADIYADSSKYDVVMLMHLN